MPPPTAILYDAALRTQLLLQGADCAWGDLTFKALVSSIPSPGAADARGPAEIEHELQATVRRADFEPVGLPAPGATLTIDGASYPIARIHAIPGEAHANLILRQPA